MSNSTNQSRRDLLVTIAAVGLAAAAPSSVDGAATNDSAGDLSRRRKIAKRLRVNLAQYYSSRPLRSHPTNGDEDDIKFKGRPTYIANYSKGLPHNEFGEVDFAAYKTLLAALESGDPDRFEQIVLGALAATEKRGNRLVRSAALRGPGKRFYRAHSERALVSANSQQMRLVNPQAGLAFDLEGPDSHELVIPPAPSFRSKEIIGEMAESYWMALARDVPFIQYSTNKLQIAPAVKDLSAYTAFKGPKTGGQVTPDTVFRGATPGDLTGPFVSQFLLQAIPFGAYRLPQQVVYGFKDDPVFMHTAADWLARQNGKDPNKNPESVPAPKFIYRGRDLANFVHIDELFQAYLNAALLLGAPPGRGGLGAPHGEGNPYDGYVFDLATRKPSHRVSTQLGFGTLGEPNIKSIVAEVATRALKAVWYQKWFVHRRLRPEVFAGRIHFHKKRGYPFDRDEFAKLGTVLDAVEKYNKAKKGSGLFLPMAFPEGSPLHPSYGAGHATVAGACTTLLKAFYYEDISFLDLEAPVVVASEDGCKLMNLKEKDYGPYKYRDLAPTLTVGGELNKLASNISLGRNFAGVHWRADHTESLKLGEQVALQMLRETVLTYNEHVRFTITKFDGNKFILDNS